MKVLVKFIDMFTGEGPDVGIFTCIDPDPTSRKISLEILPAAYETKDRILISLLKNMQKKIDSEFLLTKLIRTNSPHSILQYYKL